MPRRAYALLPLLLLLAWALFVFSPLVADPDLWGHVRFGQDTLQTGRIVRADTYSYLTAGQRWINHEWLSEVLYALAHNVAGPRGLIVLNLLLGLLIAGLLYRQLCSAGITRTGGALLTGGICLVLRPGVLNVRPQVFTYILFLALLILLSGYTRQRGSAAARLLVPSVWLLLALWVNLHGGVLAGAGILFLWGVTYLAREIVAKRSLRVLAERHNRIVVLTLLLAPTALLLNPYGPELISFLLRTATVPRPEIVEWQGVRASNPWSWYWFAALLLTLAAVALSGRPRHAALLVPLAVVALLPLSAVRHIPLFAVAAPALAADHFAGAEARVRAWLAPRAQPLQGVASMRGLRWLPLAGAVILVLIAAPRLGDIVILPSSAGFPVRAVAFLKATVSTGNMATEFNWGEYVIWHLAPAIRVSIDGRRETVYSEEVYRENLDFMNGRGRWDRLVERPETNLALVDRERPVYGLMLQKASWRLIYEDEAAAVFARNDVHPAGMDPPIPGHWPANGAGLAFPVE